MKNFILATLFVGSLSASSQATAIDPGQFFHRYHNQILVRYDPATGWDNWSIGAGPNYYEGLSFNNSVLQLEHLDPVKVELTAHMELKGSWSTSYEGAPFDNVAEVSSLLVRTRVIDGQTFSSVLQSPGFGPNALSATFPLLEGLIWSGNIELRLFTHFEIIPIEVDLVDPTKPASFWFSGDMRFWADSGRVLVPDGGATALLLGTSIAGIAMLCRRIS